MIKVEHTKTHLILAMGIYPEKRVLVTEAKLVLVYNPDKFDSSWNYKSIFISETEKIKDGDWIYESDTKFINIASKDYKPNANDFKILALPEHLSPQHLQMYVDGKLKDGDKVLIECEEYYFEDSTYTTLRSKIIKLNPNITIYPVEEKMVPLSVAEAAYDAGYDRALYVRGCEDVTYLGHMPISKKEWFEQNLK